MHAPETIAALHDRIEDNRKNFGNPTSELPAPVAVEPAVEVSPNPEEENKDVA